MQIRHLKAENFRGTARLEWVPGAAFCCLIGPGDAGKSTVLDAIEAVLSSRWFSFGAHDFHRRDTAKMIASEGTVGELSNALESDAGSPTNHLDIVTKRALVKALADYEDTLVFVSHDRQFLRALANRVLELSHAGPRIYGGSYDEYVASTGREAPGMRALA